MHKLINMRLSLGSHNELENLKSLDTPNTAALCHPSGHGFVHQLICFVHYGMQGMVADVC